MNTNGKHFLEGFSDNLGKQLNINLPLKAKRPFIYLDEWEREDRIQEPYVLINAGIKSDFTVKGAGTKIYQEIVDYFAGRGFYFVQVGGKSDIHPPLKGVADWIGKTSFRELFYLAKHSIFGIGGESFLHHVYAAFEKPYVCYVGGRVPLSFCEYPNATILHTVGKLDCCRTGGCGKRRVVDSGDNHPFNKSLCSLPMKQDDENVAGCMVELGSEPAIEAIKRILKANYISV